MANNKQRYINTKFWNDTYVAALDPIEKLLFIYLLTNGHTNISGIYELPFKVMAVETGIDAAMFKKIIPRLKDKIRYIEGMVVIKNFIKHQETGSVNVQKGILNCLKELDQNFLKTLIKQGYYILPRYYMDTLCIPYIEGRNYLDSNLDSNSNSNFVPSNKLDGQSKEKQPLLDGHQWRILIDSFKPVNPMFLSFYTHKVQRNALEKVVQQIGFDQTLEHIKSLKEVGLNKYGPKITKPTELALQLGKLILFKNERNNSVSNKGPVAEDGKYDKFD